MNDPRILMSVPSKTIGAYIRRHTELLGHKPRAIGVVPPKFSVELLPMRVDGVLMYLDIRVQYNLLKGMT